MGLQFLLELHLIPPTDRNQNQNQNQKRFIAKYIDAYQEFVLVFVFVAHDLNKQTINNNASIE